MFVFFIILFGVCVLGIINNCRKVLDVIIIWLIFFDIVIGKIKYKEDLVC